MKLDDRFHKTLLHDPYSNQINSVDILYILILSISPRLSQLVCSVQVFRIKIWNMHFFFCIWSCFTRLFHIQFLFEFGFPKHYLDIWMGSYKPATSRFPPDFKSSHLSAQKQVIRTKAAVAGLFERDSASYLFAVSTNSLHLQFPAMGPYCPISIIFRILFELIDFLNLPHCRYWSTVCYFFLH